MRLIPIVATSVVLCTACATSSPPAQTTATTVAAEVERTPTQWPEGDYIINLYDAFGEKRDELTQSFGFSALVRHQGKTILFDSGTNADVLKANVEALGLDLRDIDFAVASHAHFDHINGFDYLLEVNPEVKIYFPNDLFWGGDTEFSIGSPEAEVAQTLPPEQRYFHGAKEKTKFNQTGRFWKANIEFVDGHTEIVPGITLIATRSPYMGYFTRYPSLGGIENLEGKEGSDVKTIGLPELSMNIATPNGDVLIVGCSHSMVETIVRTTREQLKRPIGLVYGGYHLLPYKSEEIRGIATRMKEELGVAAVAPTHCTGHAGFKVFGEVFAGHYFAAGLGSTTAFPKPDMTTMARNSEE